MKKSELLLTALKPPVDYVAIVAAAVIAYVIRYQEAIQQIRPVVFDLSFGSYFALTLGLAVVGVLIFALLGSYPVRARKKISVELSQVFVGCLALLAVVLGIMVFSRYLFESRFIIVTAWILAMIFVSAGRLLIRTAQGFAYVNGFGVHRVAIIGQHESSSLLANYFSTHPTRGFRIVATYEKFDTVAQNALLQLVNDNKLDEVVLVNPNADMTETSELVNFASDHHLDFKYTANLLDAQLSHVTVSTVAGLPVVEVRRTNLDGWGRITKRLFDIVGATLLIILTFKLMVLVAILIKLTSKGPVLFSYKRIGQNGKPFRYFKFRSMYDGSHELRYNPEFAAAQENLREGTPMIKFRRDPRITPVGRFIRRFSIDELPEFFLVIAGTMSLVGPRPHELQEVERYSRHHKKLLTIKPGITGMAQVSGRSDLNFEDEVTLDTYYIENWSLRLDTLILLKTPFAILKRRQAE